MIVFRLNVHNSGMRLSFKVHINFRIDFCIITKSVCMGAIWCRLILLCARSLKCKLLDQKCTNIHTFICWFNAGQLLLVISFVLNMRSFIMVYQFIGMHAHSHLNVNSEMCATQTTNINTANLIPQWQGMLKYSAHKCDS